MTKLIIELPSWEVNKNDLAEIANKMQAIELSFNDLINDIPELKNFDNFEDYTIEANLSDQYDEFFIAGKINDEEKNIFLEVVTREVAILNDKELLSMSGSGYTKSEIENDYEVGGALSGYEKLGNTNYFYREM
jgi:hypothetical protein